jgi:hypothetical protein
VNGWTLEQAQSAQRQFEAVGGDPMDPAAPIAQWLVQPELAKLRQRFEAGENQSWQLSAAVNLCLSHGLEPPEWLVAAFSRAWLQVMRFDARSLEAQELFGPPLPKGTNLAVHHERRQWALRVYQVATERHETRGQPIDEGLWEVVRKELLAEGSTLSASTIRDYYYFAKSLLRDH